MQDVVTELANRAITNALNTSQNKYLIALAGVPGAGKTQLAKRVCDAINQLHPGMCVVVPMDGHHLYRRELDAMPDPVNAHKRRGAPWTFSTSRLLNLLLEIRNKDKAFAPSFDHKVGDPVENDIEISPQHKIVLVEGNYLLVQDQGPWEEISKLFDERWFVDINIGEAMQRVVRRHMGTGLTKEQAIERVETNDRLNAEFIVATSKKNANVVVSSHHDPSMQVD